jgi:hypothetical protein
MNRQKEEEGWGAGGARRKERVRSLESREGRAFGGRMLGLLSREVEGREEEEAEKEKEKEKEKEGWW